MRRTKVLHLIDDTTAGGVTRVVDHIIASPELAQDAEHRLLVLNGEGRHLRHKDADVIVSHLSVNWRNLPRFVAMRLCNPRARLIHIEHSYTESFVRLNVRRKGRFKLLLRLAFRQFDRVAAVSDAQCAWLRRIGVVPAQKLTAIRSFVDLSAFEALEPVAGPIRVIGAIGRLEPQKGFDTLIREFTSTDRSDLELHIFGAGSDEAKLRSLAGSDPRISFKGFAADPVAAMDNVDAVVMPSRWEAYGLVAIEALAARRPLFVSGLDGLRDHLSWGASEVQNETPGAWRATFEGMNGEAISESKPQSLRHLETEFIKAWRTEAKPVLNWDPHGPWERRVSVKL